MSESIKTNCPRDCYDGCGMIVEKRADGRLRVLGDPDHPVTRGKLCSKCAVAYNGVWQDPKARLKKPLKRVGPIGSGEFEPVSWDEALSAIAHNIGRTIDNHGAAAVLHTHYSGTLSLMAFLFPNRLFNYLGASEVDPDSICNAAGHVAWHLTYGNSIMGFDPRTAKDSRCILIWGANPSHSAPHADEHWLADSPAQVIVIDPIRTETAERADLHLQPRPGTDAALAYSLLHCLQKRGAFDEEFIKTSTLGADEIEDFIAVATPAWGETRTGVAAQDIEQAAEMYAAGPALLWCGQGLQRQETGGNVMRAAALLPTLTGNIGKPGAGFCYLNVTPAFAGIDLDWLSGANLKRDGGKTVSHMELASRLESTDEFKTFFSWNTNPLASAPDQTRLRQALKREDLFTVVCDVFMTDTARYADIVLPAASFLEFDDLTFSYFHYHMGVQTKTSEPMGEALPNPEIFRRLARALGFDEPALLESDDAMLAKMMTQMNCGFGLDELKTRGYFPLDDQVLNFWSALEFETPSGRIEIASEGAEEMGLPRVPQPWADGELSADQFRLLSPASKWRLNDSYANDPNIDERAGGASVHLNPGDAARLGLADGSAVELVNAAGRIELTARLTDAVLEGTAVSYKGRWPSVEMNGKNINFVHQAKSADMGDSTSVHSTTVEIRAL